MTASEMDIADCADLLGAADATYHRHDWAGVAAKVEEAKHHPGWHGLSPEVRSSADLLEAKAQAMAAYHREDWDAAISWYTELAPQAGGLAHDDARDVFHHLGVAWMHKGDLAQAVKYWEQAGYGEDRWPPEYRAHLDSL